MLLNCFTSYLIHFGRLAIDLWLTCARLVFVLHRCNHWHFLEFVRIITNKYEAEKEERQHAEE